MSLSLCFLVHIGVAAARPSSAASLPADSAGLLPAGFLSARGSQIVGPDGTPVRIASVGLTGMNVIGGRLQLAGQFKGIEGHVAAMRAMGFNCARVDWIDRTLDDPRAMAQLDTFVAACKQAGLKVVFDNHNNEATRADWENAAQQKNGLWFDTGPGTDGTDGAGNPGTVSAAKFQEDWVTFARHWAGNPTVIGFDIRNEPCAHTKTPALWGGKGPTDIHAMYEAVGNAILAVNPDALIICEAVINYNTGAYEGDLSVARGLPIVLRNPAKLVYSVHEYPKEIGEYRGPESGAGYIDRMNKTWGWLITEDVAPVWIGEMGASMNSAASKAWGRTLLDYMNGKAPGGPTFSRSQQPISGDWWAWGCLTGQNPNGCVGEDGQVRPEQAAFINQMLFRTASSALKPPYPRNPVIESISWDWQTYATAAPGSDLWPVAWGSDDHLYAAWGDGGGFGGTDSDGRVALGFARIEGTPEHWRGINVNGGKNPEHPASFLKKGKTTGIAFVDGVLYAMINLEDGTWPAVNHALAWSTNNGATWARAEWLFPKGEGNFQPAKFAIFGQDYTGLPEPLAGYVYIYGPKQSPDKGSGHRLYLARAPRNGLRERAAYEFFQRVDAAGAPVWVANSAQAQPVFTDPNGVTPGSVVYDPGMSRFLLTCFHVGPGQLGVFDAPTPWGPWTTVAYYEDWGQMGAEGEGLTCGFPQKWMSADGLTLWSIFSVYGDGAKKGINAHDKFNLVKATLRRH
jgi:hypothetical protein